jgi:hypothetical protein
MFPSHPEQAQHFSGPAGRGARRGRRWWGLFHAVRSRRVGEVVNVSGDASKLPLPGNRREQEEEVDVCTMGKQANAGPTAGASAPAISRRKYRAAPHGDRDDARQAGGGHHRRVTPSTTPSAQLLQGTKVSFCSLSENRARLFERGVPLDARNGLSGHAGPRASRARTAHSRPL